jgi:hypothetical protein
MSELPINMQIELIKMCQKRMLGNKLYYDMYFVTSEEPVWWTHRRMMEKTRIVWKEEHGT